MFSEALFHGGQKLRTGMGVEHYIQHSERAKSSSPPSHPAPSPPLPQGVLPGALVEFLGSSLGSGSGAEGTRFAILSHNFESIFPRPSQPVSEGSWRVPGGVKCLAKIEIFANGCQKLRTGMAMLKLDV